LQNNYFSTIAEDGRPILLKYVKENELSNNSKKYLDLVKAWNLEADPASKGQTIFQAWWDSLKVGIWKDELSRNVIPPVCGRKIKRHWNSSPRFYFVEIY
jgi:penicillin amidase